MIDTIVSSLSQAVPPAELSGPLKALWWLKKGELKLGPEWEKAHEICQSAEGIPAYDIVHGLAHWIEGDLANADYWFRRAGSQRGGSGIEREWQRLAAGLS